MNDGLNHLVTPAMAATLLGAPGLPNRVLPGSVAGGQFAVSPRAETTTTLGADPARFGPNGEFVQDLLDWVAVMTTEEAAAIGAHAPIVTVRGRMSEMFCPNADAISYGNLARYRRIARAQADDENPGPLHNELRAAMDQAATASAGLPVASAAAVEDAAVALVMLGKIHAVAYDTLTRAVRQALGQIHPGDGPVRR